MPKNIFSINRTFWPYTTHAEDKGVRVVLTAGKFEGSIYEKQNI